MLGSTGQTASQLRQLLAGWPCRDYSTEHRDQRGLPIGVTITAPVLVVMRREDLELHIPSSSADLGRSLNLMCWTEARLAAGTNGPAAVRPDGPDARCPAHLIVDRRLAHPADPNAS